MIDEKTDDRMKSEEQNPKPDSENMSKASDTTYGMGKLAKLAADYGAALDEIRESLDGLKRNPAQFDLYADFIDKHLKAVGK